MRPRTFILLVLVLALALAVSGCGDNKASLKKKAIDGAGKTRHSFSVSAEGVIKDNNTGLEWVVGPDRGLSYTDAEAWVRGCHIAGGGWRMPTEEELKGLYVEGLGEHNIDPVFKTTGKGMLVYAADPGESWTVYVFYFDVGFCNMRFRNSIGYDDDLVFGVRSAKK